MTPAAARMSVPLPQAVFIFLLAALASVPVALDLRFLYFDVAPKVVLAFVAGALGCLWFACGRPIGVPNGRILIFAVTAYAAVLILATVVSAAPHLSLGGSLWRRFGMAVRLSSLIAVAALFVLIYGRPDRWLWVVRAFCLAAIAASVYAICQFFGFDPFLDATAYHDAEAQVNRPPSSVGHATYFATLALQVAFWGLALWAQPSLLADRILGLLTSTVCFYAMLLSGTRAGVVGAAVGVITFVLIARHLSVRVWIPVLVAVVAIALVFLSGAGILLEGRVAQWAADVGGARPLLWRDSLAMASASPLTGFGPETFTQQFPAFASNTISAAYPDHHQESTHNILLDTLLEQGGLGLLALSFLATVCVRMGSKTSEKFSQRAIFILAALAAAVTAQQFTAFTLSTYVVFLVNLALIASLGSTPAPAGSISITSRAAWLLIGILCLGLAVRFSQREIALRQIDASLKSGNVTAAMDTYEHLDTGLLFGETPDLWYSRQLLTSLRSSSNAHLKDRVWRAALQSAVRASTVSEERHNAHFHLAYLWSLSEDARKMEESLRAAISWAPGWYKPHWYLSKLLAAKGQKAEAEQEASLARSLSGGRQLE